MTVATGVRLFIIALAIFALDQFTKLLAVERLVLGVSVPVIRGLFDLTLVYNKGAAFGMFSSWPDPTRRIALLIVSIIAVCVVIRFVLNEARNDTVSQIALAGILAGALGNIADRFRLDAVVDFLDFYYRTYHWPAFNVADSAICVGVALLMLRMLFGPREISHG